MTTSNYLTGVKEQYEDYPYPSRDPLEEKNTLRATDLELLDYLNFKCFRGRQNFSRFRALVAGGGTGDAAIFLAEQLRGRDAEVVYVDISSASRAIAEERARIRGLDNIVWHQASILDLPDMDIGTFDYINCCGVLHHLADPDAGLSALRSVLRPGGCMGLMLYASIGRTAIYQMQDLMRMINADETSIQKKIDHTKAILGQLPGSNWFKMTEKTFPSDHVHQGDIGIYDMFLHQQDRAYSVDQMFEFIDRCKLNFVGYSYHRSWRYRPESYLKDRSLLGTISRFDARRQNAIAELIAGNIMVHSFYVSTEKHTQAGLNDLDNIPYFYFYGLDGAALCELMQRSLGQAVTLCPTPNIKITLEPGKYTHLFFKYIDGKRSLRKIFRKIQKELGKSIGDNVLRADFEPVYTTLSDADWLLLRGPSAKPVPMHNDMQERVSRRYKSV